VAPSLSLPGAQGELLEPFVELSEEAGGIPRDMLREVLVVVDVQDKWPAMRVATVFMRFVSAVIARLIRTRLLRIDAAKAVNSALKRKYIRQRPLRRERPDRP
jgi:hypothetical protein